MAVSIKYIQFGHSLLDASNTAVKNVSVIVQFYNVNVKSWMSLTDSLTLTKGKLAHQLTIPSRISTKDQTIRIVREVLKSGGTPSFRIIKDSKESRIPEVIASNFKTTISGEDKLVIDFGKSWLLKKESYVTKEDHVVIASEVPMFELANSIKEIAAQKDEATAQIAGLNTTIASLSNDRETLSNELATVRNDITIRDQEVSSLNANMQTLQANLANEKLQIETLQANQTTLETQLAAQREQIEAMEAVNVNGSNFEVLYNDLQQEVVSINIDKNSLQQQVVDITIERDNLNQEKTAFLTSISQLQNEVKQEKALVTVKNKELQNKELLIKTLKKDKEVLQRELEEVKDFTVTAHPNKLSASKVYGSIVKDVIKADEELGNSKYKLANVSLNLKTTVEKGPEGTVFGLLDYESAKDVNSAAISDISIDIVPTATTTINEGQKMPNILGLTETAVRKVLTNNGLKLDAIYHSTKDTNLIAGQSFKQSPAPKERVEEGQEVIVIFAKPIN
ncbi:PASTA domain-containing protein [uncultured Kordia sp.]|uniref:PASTA domain-containing protein n=1 Tax=uncultured Kordia sp. TaxID=507699 RepID=UPI00262D86BC|nr:PASTA domain-containing protein [uncultured Kordia sp.]